MIRSIFRHNIYSFVRNLAVCVYFKIIKNLWNNYIPKLSVFYCFNEIYVSVYKFSTIKKKDYIQKLLNEYSTITMLYNTPFLKCLY